jgi:hypothetical protein
MKASTSASSPLPAAGVPNAIQVFQNALDGQPANDGPVTGSQIDDVIARYPPAIDASMMGDGPDPAASRPNAMQVFQNALAGQPANDDPVAGSQMDDAMGPYPSVTDPATSAYPLAQPPAVGSPNAFQVFQSALANRPANDDPVASDQTDGAIDPSASAGDVPATSKAPDPAANDYPLAIQGLLGDGMYAQPYTDALSQLSLNTAPPQPNLHVVRPGETVSGIARGDYAKMAAIAQANHLKLAADGSPIIRPGDLLLIPDTSGLDPAAHGRMARYGRNMVAVNAQTMAQQRGAQAAAQNANLQLLDRIDPPLSMPENSWGAPDFSTGRLFTPVTPEITPNPVDDHLYHTGIGPLDIGLNFASGIGGAEWQTAKGIGDFLFNNNPLGAAVGLADRAGWLRNVPNYVPDQQRTLQPFIHLGHELATHPDQVWHGAQQAVGNWRDSLLQGDPNERAYAWGGTAFNALMAADGIAGAAGLASKIGSLGRAGQAIDALAAARAAETAAPNIDNAAGLASKIGSLGRAGQTIDALAAARAAETAAPNIDNYVASTKATPAVSIGNSGYQSIGDFTDAVTAKYQALYDQHYANTMQLVDSGELPNDRLIVGNRVDTLAREGLRNWLANVEAIDEGPGQIIQVNRRLYDPAGSGAYRVPDVHIPGSKTILDGSLSFKTRAIPQIKDFRTFSGGANTTIIRPATAPYSGVEGSYGIFH